jgi:hypothetical protein
MSAAADLDTAWRDGYAAGRAAAAPAVRKVAGAPTVTKSARPPLTEDQVYRRYLAGIVNGHSPHARAAADALARLDQREYGLRTPADWTEYMGKAAAGGVSWLG